MSVKKGWKMRLMSKNNKKDNDDHSKSTSKHKTSSIEEQLLLRVAVLVDSSTLSLGYFTTYMTCALVA